MRMDQKQMSKYTEDMRKNQIALKKSQEEAIERTWRSKVLAYEKQIQEMHYEQTHHIRSQLGYQQNYIMKRMQMFAMMRKFLSNIDEQKRSITDQSMLDLAKRFINEESLVLRYQHEQEDPKMPSRLVKERIYQTEMLDLRKKYQQAFSNYCWNSNRADLAEQRIQEFSSEIEALKKENIELKQRIPILENSNQLLVKACSLKEKEVRELVEQKQNLEIRWKNQAKEPYKFTARPILQALELKSLNELSGQILRATRNARRALRGSKEVACLTR